LEIKFVYIVSPLKEETDQELESFYLPSNKVGKFKVSFNIKPPDYSTLSLQQIIGVTIILLVISYKNHEFMRVGYYLNNEILLKEDETEKIKNKLSLEYIKREILTTKPRVTIFPCLFD